MARVISRYVEMAGDKGEKEEEEERRSEKEKGDEMRSQDYGHDGDLEGYGRARKEE